MRTLRIIPSRTVIGSNELLPETVCLGIVEGAYALLGLPNGSAIPLVRGARVRARNAVRRVTRAMWGPLAGGARVVEDDQAVSERGAR